jgi:stage II sporulation protein D
MRHIQATFLFLILQLAALTNEVVNVGLFWDGRPKGAVVSVAWGSYSLIGDGVKVRDLSKADVIQLTVSGSLVKVSSAGTNIGNYLKVKLIRQSWGSSLNVKAVNPSYQRREYNDNLFASSSRGKLKLVNNVYIEHYIAGVVEAESGIKEGFEYYKVQAIIARTYALSNLNKFAHEGFNLCDNVECQVYKGKSKGNADIIRAVNATKGLVIVDKDIELINAVFHSNSGGQTVNSEDAWSKPVHYLRAINDDFSKDQPHYAWEVNINKEKWLNYLYRRFNYPIGDPTAREYVLDFCPSARQVFLTPLDTSILLKTIRRDWGLKSTYFTIEEEGENIRVTGKGFGHGVGLSQEGAMKMANMGIPFNEILHYYYKDIHLIHLSALDFFRAD